MLEMVRDARQHGLKTPVLFMGYYNPILRYGEAKLLADCKKVGVNGFILVDLPIKEAIRFREGCTKTGYVKWINASDNVENVFLTIIASHTFH